MPGAFLLSQSDKRPMYLQIMEQIKQRIIVGDWAEGQPIPSIRQLAVDLEVSVITVKRAYYELEREGVIVTHHGKGSHVASTPGLGRSAARAGAGPAFRAGCSHRGATGHAARDDWKNGCAKPETG